MVRPVTDLELGPLRFGVVGAGRLGLAMARGLQAAGFEVVHASSRSASGRDRATHLLGVPAHEDPRAVTEQVDCVLLCVPDDAQVAVVEQLATRRTDASPIRVRYVSTSSAGGLSALAPLTSAGHDACVLHPAASFVQADGDHGALHGAGAAIGAHDDASRTLAHALAHALGMVPFDLEEPAWPLHAAACTASANFTLSVLAMAEDIAAEMGLHEGVARATYGRLAAAGVERAVRSGAVATIGGPVLRGDATTLATQARAVAEHLPAHEAAFLTLAASTIRRTFEAGRIDVDTALRLGTALDSRGDG